VTAQAPPIFRMRARATGLGALVLLAVLPLAGAVRFHREDVTGLGYVVTYAPEHAHRGSTFNITLTAQAAYGFNSIASPEDDPGLWYLDGCSFLQVVDDQSSGTGPPSFRAMLLEFSMDELECRISTEIQYLDAEANTGYTALPMVSLTDDSVPAYLASLVWLVWIAYAFFLLKLPTMKFRLLGASFGLLVVLLPLPNLELFVLTLAQVALLVGVAISPTERRTQA